MDQQFARIMNAYKLEVIDADQLKVQNDEHRAERQDKEKRLVEVERILGNREHRDAWAQRVRESIVDFPNIWEHLNLEERQGLLLELMEQASIDRTSNEAKEVVLTIKLALLPQYDVVVPLPHCYRGRLKATGVEGLTRRQLAYLYHVSQRLETKAVGEAMELTLAGLNWLIGQVRRHLVIHDMVEAAKLAGLRINKMLSELPLGPTKVIDARPLHGLTKENFPPILMEVFPLLAAGATVAQVVEMTGLKKPTVGYRRKRIFTLLGTNNIFEAGRIARELGILY
jgi:DNA-binding CsgD family transcriptional regulator